MREGHLKTVCGKEVSVMSGSYDYYGPDGVMYKVDWYADETGFHPTLDHLPQPVEPDHPEVAAAVAAQLAEAGYPAEPGPMPCPQEDYQAPLPAYDTVVRFRRSAAPRIVFTVSKLPQA